MQFDPLANTAKSEEVKTPNFQVDKTLDFRCRSLHKTVENLMGACIILLKGGKNVGESSEKKSKSLVINLSPQFLFGCPMSTHEQKPRPHQNLSVAHRETRSVVCLLRPRTKAKKKRREKQSRSGSSALAFNHGAIMPRSCLPGYQHETKPITTALLPTHQYCHYRS